MPKFPKGFGVMFKGNPANMITIICEALISKKYEWQISNKDLKFKCRTKINETDIWDDY